MNGVRHMEAKVFENPDFLRRHYAGHAITGLLASGRLGGKPSEDDLAELAKVAFDIANALTNVAFKGDRPNAPARVKLPG